jgi:hypothetical protein
VHGFKPGGQALITAKKLRLLHAGLRHIVRNTPGMEGYEEQYGVPVNLEDMLGTIMGLGFLVIEGLQQLKMGLKDWEAEDMYYLWTVFARAMGIHPPEDQTSTDFVPMTIAEAQEFYASYARRHYVSAADNPEGVELARENLNMLKDLMPWPLRLLGLGVIPHMYMEDLIGKEGCARVGIKPVRGRWFLNFVMIHLGAILVRPFEKGEDPKDPHDHWSRAFFQRMINKEYGGEVEFLFPQDLEDLRKLA